MSTNSMIAKSVILVSALIGGVVGMFELSDRLAVSTEIEGGTVNQSGSLGGSGQQSGTSGEDAVQTDDAAAAMSPKVGSALEQEISVRVAEQLLRFECADVTVDRVTATAIVVPDTETSHGFEGHTLEGAVVLAGDGGPERMRLAGSGKGQTGAISAVDMALRGFGEQVQQTDIFKENCKGD